MSKKPLTSEAQVRAVEKYQKDKHRIIIWTERTSYDKVAKAMKKRNLTNKNVFEAGLKALGISTLTLLFLACNEVDKSLGPKEEATDHSLPTDGKFFSFRLDEQCSGVRTIQDGGSAEMADSAFDNAKGWRAWSEVGEGAEKVYYPLEMKKGPQYWEPSCDHPWNADSMGNVKSVVVWH
jgi:hypothetical protein